MGSRAMAADHPLPKTLPRETAGRFGDLYILYNDRICPLQTFARDFTIKLYGKPTYHGLTSEQVLTGWLFYYDSWKNEPVIRIKSNEARRLLDIKGQYASVKDFAGNTNEYKLEDAMRQIHLGRQITDRKGIEEANEKFNIISMVCTGALMKIFPYRDAKGNTLQWYAQSDRLPHEMGNEQWTFTRKAMNYVHEQIVMKRFDEVNRLLNKIKQYQQKECGEALPSASRFKAEKLYNQFDYSKPIAILCLCIGLFAFIYYCRCTVTEKNICCSLAFIFNLLLCSIFQIGIGIQQQFQLFFIRLSGFCQLDHDLIFGNAFWRFDVVFVFTGVRLSDFRGAYFVGNGFATVDDGKTVDYANVKVRLESTIGIYGTGLIDAIPDDSLKAEYIRQEKAGVSLNPSFFANGEWVKTYSNTTHPFRYTYALSRGPLQDAAGANAIWNITNVTRSNRRYHYMTQTYANTAANDPEVQNKFYEYFPDWNKTGNVKEDIINYLMNQELPVEMTDDDYVDFMIWHRGLAVPAARNLDDPDVQKGRSLFREIGCASCHRPSWKTGKDNFTDPSGFFSDGDARLPRYPDQTIWPYSDFVQHRLYMENDIRTGWCRTTPLWGRGLSAICTGASDRLHDCRARNVIEAIMWHGNAQSDARWTIEKFRTLSKEDREAVVKFIEAI
jgi:hypothetical protein